MNKKNLDFIAHDVVNEFIKFHKITKRYIKISKFSLPSCRIVSLDLQFGRFDKVQFSANRLFPNEIAVSRGTLNRTFAAIIIGAVTARSSLFRAHRFGPGEKSHRLKIARSISAN